MIWKLVVPVVETTGLPARSASLLTLVPVFTRKRVPV